MKNFGVIEVASTRTTNAPGWAYVPDTGPHPSIAPGAAQSRKRARHAGANLSYADLNARQEAKIRKELEILNRDNSRDLVIPIPPKKSGREGGRTGQGKHTANVRKILQSQKTFANHLDDFIALGDGGAGGTASAAGAASAAAGGSSRSAAAAAMSRSKVGSATTQQPPSKKPATAKQEDVEVVDASESRSSVLQPYTGPLPKAHPSDNDPLLISRVPPLPSDDELRELLAAPHLNYLEAQAGWNEEDQKYPVRVFCAVCGYWGRVQCMKCGTRVCALECLEAHREECLTRYGI
ncbi:HIT zinc finger protein [Xylariales sp. PMI_506]|nr:HIT zinc finger protein [Xylariales sp. PMI_506]